MIKNIDSIEIFLAYEKIYKKFLKKCLQSFYIRVRYNTSTWETKVVES